MHTGVISGTLDPEPTVISVDRVDVGRGIVTCGNRQASIAKDGRRLYVEDAHTEEFLGYLRSYRHAGDVVAKAWGITDYVIQFDDETKW
ncbi:hypothetical protein [Amycolatopsis lexingtonensis]|uniref:hypothetical protein n=1 Tax=Amycolatopsis lexingtonensis TaxID=218822 RepID=UPI003F6F970C